MVKKLKKIDYNLNKRYLNYRMFSLRNKIKISYIDKKSFLYSKYNIFSKNLSQGNWYFEKSDNHFIGVNKDYNNFNKKEFTLKLEDCDLFINVNNKKYYFNGEEEEYFCKITYYEYKDKLSYIRLDKRMHKLCLIEDENLKYYFLN
jgi:hypothetical protein